MAGQHPAVGLALAVARIGEDVGGSDHTRPAKCRFEHRCIPRHWEICESFAGRARQCVKRVGLAVRPNGVIKERPEFRAAEFNARVGDDLYQVFEVQFCTDRNTGPVENFEGVSLLPQFPDACFKRFVNAK